MRFADPLFFLLLAPAAAAVAWHLTAVRRAKAPLRFPALSLLEGLGSAQAEWRLKGPALLRGAALVFFIIALARPQRAAGRNETSANVTDIMICLDASQSMTSVDFQPKDRFTVAREVTKKFILGRQVDRIGLVVFGRIAMTQCPLTLDYNALVNVTNAAHIGTVPADHTAIGDALLTAVNRLKNSAAKSKVIVLATDGDNNAGMVDPLTAAKAAATFHIRIYTIGVGVPGQGKMPVDDPVLGRRLIPIADDLDESSLQKIALTTGGRYFRATSSEALETIFKQIDQLEKTEIKVKEFTDYEELFRPLALAALLLLAGEQILNLTIARVLP
jgi:Ca-activated chloride channel family protein